MQAKAREESKVPQITLCLLLSIFKSYIKNCQNNQESCEDLEQTSLYKSSTDLGMVMLAHSFTNNYVNWFEYNIYIYSKGDLSILSIGQETAISIDNRAPYLKGIAHMTSHLRCIMLIR